MFSSKIRIVFAFSISILVLITIGVYSYYKTRQYKATSDFVNHTQRVISETQGIILDIQTVESLQRAFVITGDKRYLNTQDERLHDIQQTYKTVRKSIRDNKNQQLILDTLYRLINIKTKL